MKRILINELKEIAKQRPDGYYEDVVSKGNVTNNGQVLEIDDKILMELRNKYSPPLPPKRLVSNINKKDFNKAQVQPPMPTNRMRGFGDAVYKIANPIAKAIDAVAGTNIQGCGGCKKRREYLNKVLPFRGK